MKQNTLFLLFISVWLVSGVDYNSDPWSTAACMKASAPTGSIESPIDMTGSSCRAYETFSLSSTGTVPTTFTYDSTTTGAFTAAFTGLSLTVNDNSYTSSQILLRYGAENVILANSEADMEMQIALDKVGGGTQGFLSFLIRQRGAVTSPLPTTSYVTVTSGTPDVVTIDLDGIVAMINNKISSGLYLNILTYEGTTTYPPCNTATWFVYGAELYVDASTVTTFQTLVSSTATASDLATGGKNRRSALNGGGTQTVERLCFTGYFKNYMNWNYGLWFGIVIIIGWFITNLMMENEPINDPDYQENTWTHHPLISIYTYGNDIFTRKERMAILLSMVTTIALFCSVFYRQADDKTKGSNIIVFAVYSMLISWAVTLILGVMLRGFVLAKNQYYKTKEDAWEQKAQNRVFAFYFALFAINIIGWPFTVWNMGELHPEKDSAPSNYWVASFFVGIGLELLIVDPIICLLAKKIGLFRTYAKYKGFFYDNVCHDTYLTYLKWD